LGFDLTRMVAGLPAFLLAIILHEVAHGYVAYRLGDDTAKRAGRLTLSPLPHIDPIGALFYVLSSFAGAGFGWAKPVPISLAQLRNPRRDEMLVTLAGPAANLIQAVVWALLLRGVMLLPSGQLGASLVLFCYIGLSINVLLMFFNLMPIPPLDGSHVAFRLLGAKDPYLVERLAPLGFVALIVLLNTRAFGLFYSGLVDPFIRLLLPAVFR
jgi:Zn-dependent protease